MAEADQLRRFAVLEGAEERRRSSGCQEELAARWQHQQRLPSWAQLQRSRRRSRPPRWSCSHSVPVCRLPLRSRSCHCPHRLPFPRSRRQHRAGLSPESSPRYTFLSLCLSSERTSRYAEALDVFSPPSELGRVQLVDQPSKKMKTKSRASKVVVNKECRE